jgi:hypothetical protein
VLSEGQQPSDVFDSLLCRQRAQGHRLCFSGGVMVQGTRLCHSMPVGMAVNASPMTTARGNQRR